MNIDKLDFNIFTEKQKEKIDELTHNEIVYKTLIEQLNKEIEGLKEENNSLRNQIENPVIESQEVEENKE